MYCFDKMRGLFLLGLVSVTLVSASPLVEVQKAYHDEIGMPLFEEIKAYEEKLASENDDDGRIVGGAVAPIGAHPYFAGLLIDFINIPGQSVCGSSLLSANRLVTAAHCWFDGRNQARQFTVILGSNLLLSGGIRIATSQVFMHPWWTPSNLNNDIAMIYLPTSVFFSATIQPIAIPNASESWNTFAGLWAVAAGFGRTSDAQAGASTVVSHVSVQVITVDQCVDTFGNNHVKQSTICTNGAGGVGICGGDSGGPLLLNNYNGRTVLIGVSSFVARAGCQLGLPSAFARVTSFRDFIIQHM